jgi:DNA-binding GntR family transcriptional regulator
MNPGATAERVLDTLRGRIAGREFRPGDRLDAAVLAAGLAASVTPVRDALHRLTGEGLVETRLGSGFYIPSLDEPLLKDLYDWSAALVLLAIRGWPRGEARTNLPPDFSQPSLPERAGALFLTIARRSVNSEHARALARLNARLHAVRTVEPLVLEGTAGELDTWLRLLKAGDRDGLRRLCMSYHRQRIRAAAELVRAVYRAE